MQTFLRRRTHRRFWYIRVPIILEHFKNRIAFYVTAMEFIFIKITNSSLFMCIVVNCLKCQYFVQSFK